MAMARHDRRGGGVLSAVPVDVAVPGAHRRKHLHPMDRNHRPPGSMVHLVVGCETATELLDLRAHSKGVSGAGSSDGSPPGVRSRWLAQRLPLVPNGSTALRRHRWTPRRFVLCGAAVCSP